MTPSKEEKEIFIFYCDVSHVWRQNLLKQTNKPHYQDTLAHAEAMGGSLEFEVEITDFNYWLYESLEYSVPLYETR